MWFDDFRENTKLGQAMVSGAALIATVITILGMLIGLYDIWWDNWSELPENLFARIGVAILISLFMMAIGWWFFRGIVFLFFLPFIFLVGLGWKIYHSLRSLASMQFTDFRKAFSFDVDSIYFLKLCRWKMPWIDDFRKTHFGTLNFLHRWRKKGLDVRMAVNLSARQLQDEGLLNVIGGVLDAFDIRPDKLELELTETCLMSDPEFAIRLVHNIKGLGVRLAMDDFGTGYSSLSYLKRFSMDTLKIDRSFVRDLPDDGQDAAIASTIITMAHNLGMRVLAEGVETKEQLDFMRAHSCDEVQGYYFSRPIPAIEIESLLGKSMRQPE